jgi:hypothetical protein
MNETFGHQWVQPGADALSRARNLEDAPIAGKMSGGVAAGRNQNVTGLALANEIAEGVHIGSRPDSDRSESDPTHDLVLHDALRPYRFRLSKPGHPGQANALAIYWTRHRAKWFN